MASSARSVLVEVEEQSPSFSVEEFHELGLLNGEGKPRLNRAIGYFCNEELDLELLEDLFCFWRDFHEYIVLRHGKTDSRSWETTWEYVAVKASKRGNDVYASRVKRRFSMLEDLTRNVEFFKAEDFKTDSVVHGKALWITLTYDTKKCSRREAWGNIGVEWNRFISAVRARYGKVSVIRSWEAFENGYPHIHAVCWFHEASFEVFPWLDKSSENARFSYRIKEKGEFEALWHSFVDIEALSSLKKVVGYVRKYQMKVSQGAEAEGSRGVKTLAFMWLFRKRSYSVSGSWREVFHDLIARLRNSNMEKQVDLFGVPFEEWSKWEFVGVFSGRDLRINAWIWACRLKGEQIEAVLRVEN